MAATLFGPRAGRNAPTPDAALVACANASDVATCLHERRFPGKVPRRYVTRIREASGWTLGLLPPRSMNGGWRGQLRLVPRLPLGPRAVHLRRMALAVEDFATFFRGLQAKAAKEGRRVDYRWRRLTIRFFESVGRGTPSAYARGWTVAYNVNGSLLRHDRGVRETLFHEIVHLNDAHHGGWSRRALRSLHADIVERCSRSGKLQNSCLKPYAPTDTKVRRYGIYYAFHPESGVGEYAAELATRYYTEHRARLAGRPVPRPFRCQTPENARAMALLVDEFFGGVDLTPPCP